MALEIQGKLVKNSRADKALTFLTGAEGLIAPEEQLTLKYIFGLLGLILFAIVVLVLFFAYFIVVAFVLEPVLGIINILLRNLTAGEISMSGVVKEYIARWITFILIVSALISIVRLLYRKSVKKDWALSTTSSRSNSNQEDASSNRVYSMAQVSSTMVPPHCIGVPVFMGMQREWWLYLPTTHIYSPFGMVTTIAVEATTITLDIGLKDITSHEGIRVAGIFSIQFQAYDYYTIAALELGSTNVCAQMIDLLSGNARMAVNSLLYDLIDKGREEIPGTTYHLTDAVNERLWKVLEKEFGKAIVNDRDNKGQEVINIAHLGIYICKVACKRLMSQDKVFQDAREAKSRATAEMAAQAEIEKNSS